MADGFLGRWSRRKADAREGKPLDEPVPPVAPASSASTAVPVTPPSAAVPATGQAAPQAREPAAKELAAQPALTLDDVQGLTKESDFKPFVAREVAPEVRNAAMKKLFTDPHFNVMDRMDVYIDDYNVTTPMPESVLRQLASAKFLGMFDDEEKKEDPNTPPGHSTGEAADADVAQDVAQSGVCNEIPSQPPASQETHAHDADLRLQPDDAARPPGTGRAAS